MLTVNLSDTFVGVMFADKCHLGVVGDVVVGQCVDTFHLVFDLCGDVLVLQRQMSTPA